MNRSFSIRLLLIVFLTQGFLAHAQRPVFGVYLTIGTIKYSPAHGGGSQPVLLHLWLYPGDKLTLADNIAEITLFGHDTSYVRLHGKGTYSTDEIGKIERTRVQDTLIIRYLSLSWAQIAQPVSASTHPAANRPGTQSHTPAAANAANPIITVLGPRAGYATSMDSTIFSWHSVSWARKYFLRLRSPEGRLCYDNVVADTEAIVHFPGRMTAGNSYTWTLDIVGESGRLQFADSGHIVLVNESAIFPQLPPVTPDPIGGIAILLQRIEQYENASCTKLANDLFRQLTTDFPQDAALDQLYTEFRNRNYF